MNLGLALWKLRSTSLGRIGFALPAGLLLSYSQEVLANPGSYGMQMCSMMRAGTSQKRAWDYIIEQHTMRTGGQMGGFGIAAGLIAGQQLRGMRSDVFAVARANCPEVFGGGIYSSSPQSDGQRYSSFCLKNPWMDECKDDSFKARSSSSSCLKALKKYDCKYTKYLEANPHMQDWVDSNPEMARKEALRLKAVDADRIGVQPEKQSTSSAVSERDDPSEKCLKAVDYKGCMEYNKSN